MITDILTALQKIAFNHNTLHQLFKFRIIITTVKYF